MDDGPVNDETPTAGPGSDRSDAGRAPLHVPVLLDRAIELLGPAITRRSEDGDGAVLIDATLGLGGHSAAFLQRFPGLRLIGIDRDTRALALATERLAEFGPRVTTVHLTYDNIPDALAAAG